MTPPLSSEGLGASTLRPLTRWISEGDLRQVYTAQYWNDIVAEQKKEWWIVDGDDRRCRAYLESSGLLRQYAQAEPFVEELAQTMGRPLIVADLAAGIGWTSAKLSRLPSVAEVHAVEISEHRLEQLFEPAVKMMGGDAAKISRYLGSFYDLCFDDRSIDLVFLSQAFHHADRPFHLLHECDRVLRPGGRIVLVGEHYVSGWNRARSLVSNLVRKRRLVTNFYEAYPPDPILGDHYYRLSDYYFMFNALGYTLQHQFTSPTALIYMADKRA